MPRDGNSQPIPVLSQGVVVSTFAGASSAQMSLPAGSKVVRIVVLEDTYIYFNDGSVAVTVGNGTYLTAGSTTDWATGGRTSVAVIRAATGGFVNITDMV